MLLICSVTTMYTLGRVVVSTDSGEFMVKESPFHGYIWPLATHSTPAWGRLLQVVVFVVVEWHKVEGEVNTSAWVLVIENKPRLHNNHEESRLHMVNSQMVPDRVEHQTAEEIVSQRGIPEQGMSMSLYESMMASMEPMVRQMFECQCQMFDVRVQRIETKQTFHTAPTGPPSYQAVLSAAWPWQMQRLELMVFYIGCRLRCCQVLKSSHYPREQVVQGM